MAKMIGIGGVFIFSRNTEQLAAWYTRHLGFSFDNMVEDGDATTYYQVLFYRDFENPDKRMHTVFAILPARQEICEVRNQAMINYRLDDLDEFVKQLISAGIAVDPIELFDDGEGKGKFTHLYDLDGNRIELWQHMDA
jgi:catechol 2,3-dioxygenase-like lactoylglutathione lyase family enzyme